LNRWFDVYAFRVGGAGSGRVALLFTDISKRREAEHALLTAKDEIARHVQQLEHVVADRTGELCETICELEAFSYSVSHDMRAPLRAMQSFASFLKEEYGDKLDPRGINYLEQIMRSSTRLDHLIQDVLSYTRILHAPLPMLSVDLDRLVRDIVETSHGQSAKSSISVTGPLPKVIGNEALLTQVISNLLSNGLKFVSRGTIPHVEITAEEIDHSVWIKFRDNGIGIAREDHNRIFRLFERINAPSEYEGTGIGLTIVRKAVERMSAQLGFESEPGKGSNFWVQLKKA
jgi:signal transduction histidine kinase